MMAGSDSAVKRTPLEASWKEKKARNAYWSPEPSILADPLWLGAWRKTVAVDSIGVGRIFSASWIGSRWERTVSEEIRQLEDGVADIKAAVIIVVTGITTGRKTGTSEEEVESCHHICDIVGASIGVAITPDKERSRGAGELATNLSKYSATGVD